jgi:hypothetical protein
MVNFFWRNFIRPDMRYPSSSRMNLNRHRAYPLEIQRLYDVQAPKHPIKKVTFSSPNQSSQAEAMFIAGFERWRGYLIRIDLTPSYHKLLPQIKDSAPISTVFTEVSKKR